VFGKNHLYHYGVKGMKWGVHKSNKPSGIKTRSARLNLFGSPGHNILYITGISGSGKSTLTLNLAKKLNAEPIHLDWYYDGRSRQETPFKKFLENNGVKLNKVYINEKLNYSESDKIFPLLKKYSKNHRLIVEGVQLLDQTMSMDMHKVLSTEPVISIQTSARVSFNRVTQRDGDVAKFINFQKARKTQDMFDNNLMLGVGEAYAKSLLQI
jgi:adenylate kinase family enzyme